MKRGLKFSVIALTIILTITTCHSARMTANKSALSAVNEPSKVYSVWHLKNRGTGEYLYDDGSAFKTATTVNGDSFNWIMETAGSYTQIRNKATGHYLNTDKSTDSSSYWNIAGFEHENRVNCGWYWLKNPHGYLLNTAGGNIQQGSTNINKDSTAHWSFIRVDGSLLPFEIDHTSVREASFMGDKRAEYVSDYEICSNYSGKDNKWVKSRDISHFPQLTAPNEKLLTALYNMALEESLLDIRPSDSTFMAGKLWPDTWTRDVVYSIYLVYSFIMPEISKRTLKKQSLKDPDEALQDTGSGGSWPISTDRVSWAIAAWEYYLATGDSYWLEESYNRLRYTAQRDIHVAYNNEIQLFSGETCSMDWRTHTYPNWFTNVNIGESYSTGTNALHAFMYFFLREAGKILNKPMDEINTWNRYFNNVKNGINSRLWLRDKNYYSSYILPPLYGYRPSERTACMDNGLAILLGVADSVRGRKITENLPLYPYGAPTLYPTIPDEYAYHNKAIWPVWETFYMLGAKKVLNQKVVEHIMKSLIRQAALFLTNKENMNYDVGFNANTAVNSDRQLWSVASYLSMIYRIIFGIDLNEQGLSFRPIVPDWMQGPFELSNFKYRNAVLNLRVSGNGNQIASLLLDGKEQPLPFVFPTTQCGTHTIEIRLKKDPSGSGGFKLVEAGEDKDWTPAEPSLFLQGNQLTWQTKPGLTYRLWDGKSNKTVTAPYTIDTLKFGIYCVYAVDANGLVSDVSKPVVIAPETKIYEAEDGAYPQPFFSSEYKGYSGKGYVKEWRENPSGLKFNIHVPKGRAGRYALQITGANGHGPDGSFAAIRSVYIDGKDAGTLILAATGNWNDWTKSNYLIMDHLTSGQHAVQILFNPEKKGWDNNMSRNKENKNDCNIDYLEVLRLE